LANINPDRIFVCASGVDNHDEFAELAERNFGFMQKTNGNTKARE